MRQLFKPVIAILLFLSSPSAFAGGIPLIFTAGEQLYSTGHIVKIDGKQKIVAVKTSGVFIFGIFGLGAVTDNYALTDSIQSDYYRDIYGRGINDLKRAGQLPQDFPVEASMTTTAIIHSFFFWISLILGGIFLVVYSSITKNKNNKLLVSTFCLIKKKDGSFSDACLSDITNWYIRSADDKAPHKTVEKANSAVDKNTCIESYAFHKARSMNESAKISFISVLYLQLLASSDPFTELQFENLNLFSTGMGMLPETFESTIRQINNDIAQN
ncbi:hypothetical protein [Motilimonas pumila]|uniref:Uncharacterized protein n=1 Tax=Motilimonas pumila TaxID=2303987 RepID=A0A418YFS3_9GAMM|nr:hypothetical protein [Motilimonas pumila]RJG48393.1 hypothetical protein D1Z90_07825 [Motilimonas pumila]